MCDVDTAVVVVVEGGNSNRYRDERKSVVAAAAVDYGKEQKETDWTRKTEVSCWLFAVIVHEKEGTWWRQKKMYEMKQRRMKIWKEMQRQTSKMNETLEHM